MFDFAAARRRMVDTQIRTADVTHRPLLAAMEIVPREAFFPDEAKPFAYTDQAIEIGRDETTGERRQALPPALLARMLQAIEPVQGGKALHVACGTGYAAALLATLGAHVTALDDDAAMIEAAKDALGRAGLPTVRVVCGPLPDGVPDDAPFNAVLIEGAYEERPTKLLDQLAEGGCLIGVEGVGRAALAMLYVKSGGAITGRAVFDASAPLLAAFARKPAFAF